MTSVNTQCFRQLAWTRCNSLFTVSLTILFHPFNALDRLERPDENCIGLIFFIRNNIEKIMNSVAEVNVSMTTMPEHDFVSHRFFALVCMTPTLFVGIRFCFYNYSSDYSIVESGEKSFSKKILCDLDDVTAMIKGFFELQLWTK